MSDSYLKKHSVKGKRQILIVEDEAINRMLLGGVLENDYEILYAASGGEGMEILHRQKELLSLVLLDLILGDMNGLDVLRRMKSDPELTRIPVIVMTSEKGAEVDCLNQGAIDFIP